MKRILTLCCALLMCLSLCACSDTKKAGTLAQYGEEMFLENDFSDYANNLKQCGLEDLIVNPTFSYDIKYDYNEKYHSLDLKCSVKFSSSDIDSYYTTTYNKAEARELAAVMGELCQHIPSTYQYNYESKKFSGTVYVTIEKPTLGFSVVTPEGRVYKYNNGYYGGYITLDIDKDRVYMVENNGDDTYSNSNEHSTGGNTTSSDKDAYGHDKFDAMVIAEKVVKDQLKSPSTADFCSTSEYTVSCVGNTWTVRGYVDAQNRM